MNYWKGCYCSGSTVIYGDTDDGLVECCVEPWDAFVDNLISLGITTVDFTTHNQLTETSVSPLTAISNSLLEIGNFIIPVCQLVGLRFTVDVNNITDADILEGLTPAVIIQGECETCEAPIRLRLDTLQAIGDPIEIDTTGGATFRNIQNVTIAGTGQGIVVAKDPIVGTDQTYYAVTICMITDLETT